MKEKKKKLANFLYYSRLSAIFSKYPLHNKLVILNYHRIKESFSSRTVFDDGVFTTDIDQFTHQILWLKENTNIIGLDELDSMLREKSLKFSSRPNVMLTFDDGYIDNYTLAYPILKTLQVPAVFFLATGMVDRRELPWWDFIAYLFNNTRKEKLVFQENEFNLTKEKGEAVEFFLNRMKTTPSYSTQHLLPELSELLEVPPPPAEVTDMLFMTWDNVREMRRNGMFFGAHTHTHKVLTTLSSSEVRQELMLSKLIIEKELQEEVYSVAYPVGEVQLVPHNIAEIAASCGFRVGFTTNSGVNHWTTDMSPYTIRRTAHLLENVSTVSLMTLFPEVFLWESRAGKEKIKAALPTYADSNYQQGLIALGRSAISEALFFFQQALEINPNYLEARIKLGLSFLLQEEADAAIQNFHRVLDNHPTFPDVLFYTAVAYALQKDFRKARELLIRSVERNQNYYPALYCLLFIHYHFNEVKEFLDVARRLLSLRPPDSYLEHVRLVLEELGEIRSSESIDLAERFSLSERFGQEVEEIISSFHLTISINPNMSELTFLVEQLPEESADLEILITLYEEYALNFSNFPDAHFALGQVYFKLKRYDEAATCFRSSLDLNPKFVKSRVQLFKTLHRKELWQEALQEEARLADYNLPYPDIYTEAAEIHFKLKNMDVCKQYLAKALSIKPNFSKALWLKTQLSV